jgi:NitT/TauT family transport system ATP-binding protein
MSQLQNAGVGDLAIQDLQIVFTLGKGVVEAVSQFDLTVRHGESVCIVGPSGCGKTSVLRAVAGFVKPTRGQIRLGERVLTQPTLDVGVVFQDGGLLPWLSVRKNVEFGLLRREKDRGARAARTREWIDNVGLSDFVEARPGSLSGGMRQRVAIARTLVGHPSVVLMDEPFGALDAQTRTTMQDLTSELIADNSMTTLFVTHDIDESLIIGDRIIVMSARPGRIVEEIENPFARPRVSADLFGDARYADLKAHILSTIRGSTTKVA